MMTSKLHHYPNSLKLEIFMGSVLSSVHPAAEHAVHFNLKNAKGRRRQV